MSIGAFRRSTVLRICGSAVFCAVLSACGGGGGEPNTQRHAGRIEGGDPFAADTGGSTIWDVFGGADNPNTTVAVNKYIWNASLDVLDFLPVETVDPFTGVIATGYGTPPGGGQAYRATIYVQDAALDARSLKLAMQTRNGRAVSDETLRQVEDAILTRARQLRIQDSRL